MEVKARILLAEDDPSFGAIIQKKLNDSGFNAILCRDGEQAWNTFQSCSFDLCLFDVEIPVMDGLTLTQTIRKRDLQIPILFLSAKASDQDRIAGLQTGADDYIPKPVSFQELVSRIEVFLRRTKPLWADNRLSYRIGSYIFDYNELILSHYNGTKKVVSQKEAELLRYFCLNPNKKVTRAEVLLNVWGTDDYFRGRSMDVFITRLRKLFADDPLSQIETIHGHGFIFKVRRLDVLQPF